MAKNPNPQDSLIERPHAINSSLYKILKIPKTATNAEIDTAFQQLAREYYVVSIESGNRLHVERKFKKINRAYMVLSDVHRRQIYDDFGTIGLYMADLFGDEKMLKHADRTGTKVGLTFAAVLTCCFCCFCCFCKECCLKRAEWDDDDLVYS